MKKQKVITKRKARRDTKCRVCGTFVKKGKKLITHSGDFYSDFFICLKCVKLITEVANEE